VTATAEARVTGGASTTPDWLLRREAALCPCGCVGRRSKGGYLQKTLTGGSDLLKQVIFAEDVAAKRGLLQRLDPRVKLVGLLGSVVVAALLHSIPALAVLYAATLGLAVASGLPLRFFLKRVWLFVPIFTGIVVLPATLSVVTPGPVILTLWTWNGYPQGFTAQGLLSAGLIVSRVAVSISLVVLLTLTTPWSRLLAALRGIGVPKIFVVIIGMTYRYIFHLLDAVTDMYQARKARSVGKPRHDRAARASVAASAGALIGKATVLSEEVHQAMTARGYTGNATTLQAFRVRTRDLVFLAVVAAFAAALLMGDVVLAR
jgi:cobalt ECF transporter T component CbiQ